MAGVLILADPESGAGLLPRPGSWRPPPHTYEVAASLREILDPPLVTIVMQKSQ